MNTKRMLTFLVAFLVLGIAAFAVFTLYFQQEPERNQDLVSPTLEPSPSADVSPMIQIIKMIKMIKNRFRITGPTSMME